jgi:hypothetical protein
MQESNSPFKVFYCALPFEEVVEIIHVRHTSRRRLSGDN